MDNAVPATLKAERLKEALARVAAALPTLAGVDEQLMSDVHGDAPAFDHLMRSASGQVRRLVQGVLGADFTGQETDAVCTLLYYPELACEDAWEGACADFDVDALVDLAEDVRQRCCGAFHLVGDIWDRGPRGDEVMATLMATPRADVQWGNHDVCWMGAAAGDPVCIATLLRNNIKYMNVEQFEEGYDIPLGPLFELGERLYADDGGKLTPCLKAINAILFKCEGQAVARHPEWHMDDRLLWGKMDLAAGEVEVYGTRHPLVTCDFPTFDAADPYALTVEEQEVMDGLVQAFTGSARLRSQVQWLYDHGSVYKVDGDLLLFHGCVPMNEDGTFAQVDCGQGVLRSGRLLLDWVDGLCRRAWEGRSQLDLDWMGYLWCGWQSTFAGRVVKTFERTYIADESTWKEPEDPYYALTCTDPAPAQAVLAEFGVDTACGRIVNGHTPVKLPRGQVPVRAGGHRVVIDGGLCKAYRKTTGIAGYTLVRRGDTLELVSHTDYPGDDEVRLGCADMDHTGEVLQ